MRQPDLIIGPRDNPQTLRYHLIKWRGFQFALHKWVRSDDDRALHDHSGWNISFILNGGYWELVRRKFRETAEGRTWYVTPHIDVWYYRRPWRFYARRADTAHRIALPAGQRPVWTLWLRGPPMREWGFHCPKGWRHWKEYCNTRDYSTPGSASEIGPGCD